MIKRRFSVVFAFLALVGCTLPDGNYPWLISQPSKSIEVNGNTYLVIVGATPNTYYAKRDSFGSAVDLGYVRDGVSAIKGASGCRGVDRQVAHALYVQALTEC